MSGLTDLLEDYHLHHLAVQFHRQLAGRRLDGVEWDGRCRFRFRFEDAAASLAVYLDSDYPACFFATGKQWPGNPDWVSCQLLECETSGLMLQECGKIEDDRQLVFRFRGGPGGRLLYLEVRPIGACLRWCDEQGTVLRLAGQVPAAARPGSVYTPVRRSGRLSPRRQEILQVIQEDQPGLSGKNLLRRITGLSPTLLAEARARTAGGDPETLAGELELVIGQAYASAGPFYLYFRPVRHGEPERLEPPGNIRLAPFPLESCRGWTWQQFDQPAGAVRKWLETVLAVKSFQARQDAVLARLDSVLQEGRRRCYSLERELEQGAGMEQWKRHGELILANLYRFGAGHRAGSVQVEDIYQDPPVLVEIPLVPEKSVQENAAQFFARYRKARQAMERLPALIGEERRRIRKWERLRDKCAGCSAPEELAPVEQQLPARRTGRLKLTVRQGPAVATLQFRQFVLASGLTVLVGKGAAENQQLSFRVARPDDYWFHAADYPGAHVVLQWGRKTEPPQRDMEEAAAIAAWFSQAVKAPLADVHATRSKFLRRVKGIAGRAAFSRARCLRVRPALPVRTDPEGASGDDASS